MPFRDLREFIAALEEIDELRSVQGADWNLEIGTLDELNYERLGPALLFDEIKDYPKGYRILTNAMDPLRRALLALDLPLDLDVDTAIEHYEKKVFGPYVPKPPVVVKSGPIHENVFTGEEIDLWKFPTPKWHEGDGGRYIGTGCMVIMKDPDTDVISFGCYRVMVSGKRTAGLYISPSHTGATIEKKYWEKGQSCPVAVSMGQDPVLFLGAGHFFGEKRQVNKYDLAGQIRGTPVEIIQEDATGLPIPATSEIVIAGEIPPPDIQSEEEGPFGEWTGYFTLGSRPEPVIRVKALYHRNDPIILGMPPKKYRRPTLNYGLPTKAKAVKERLQGLGIEEVLDVWHLAIPGFTVVQIRQRYPGHAMKAALAASGDYMGRFVVVVDEDINPRDPEDVLWAIGTRCDPETALTVLKGCTSSALDPRIPPQRKEKRDFTSSRAILIACKPYSWMKDFPKTNIAGPELRKKVVEKWGEMFSVDTAVNGRGRRDF